MKVRLNAKDALVVVDVQRDFLPGGALAVPGGDQVIQPLNAYIKLFSESGLPVFFTRDWHPDNHLSFKENGGFWPSHCVRETQGAAFSSSLLLPADNKYIISKGVNVDFDAYSGFQDTRLLSLLRERGVQRVFVGGLATDYCVKYTVSGAMNLGFAAVILLDAVQGIGDSEEAVAKMLFDGAFAITIHDCSEVR